MIILRYIIKMKMTRRLHYFHDNFNRQLIFIEINANDLRNFKTKTIQFL
jgi:hypothetical protein